MSDGLSLLVRALGRPRILVAGDLILDKFVWGTVDRVSPEAPIQILDVAREEYRPGGAANVARNLAVLGARVTCAGIVGKDAGGKAVAEALRREGIRPALSVDPRRPTPLKTRMIAHQQQVLRIDREDDSPVSPGIERLLSGVVRRAARSSDLVVLSDYHKGTLTPGLCREVIRSGRPVLVGLKGREASKYVGATAAALNRSELAALSGTEDLERGARRILRTLRLKFLVATLGDQGIAVVPAKGALVRRPAIAKEVYDVTGAGDTALAMFALAYASGLPLSDCAELANRAAGIVVGKIGTETVTREEIVGMAAAPAKIFGRSELMRRLAEERAKGRRVVFTNGCFDLLHVGHIQLLGFARSKGDVLVVALNTDASVRRLKGPGRPILRQEERGAILAALEAVDYVVFFDEETPEALIRAVRPDVLVKGQDYERRAVVGRGTVERHGGRVELAPLVQGISTSDIVDRILAPRRGRRGR